MGVVGVIQPQVGDQPKLGLNLTSEPSQSVGNQQRSCDRRSELLLKAGTIPTDHGGGGLARDGQRACDQGAW